MCKLSEEYRAKCRQRSAMSDKQYLVLYHPTPLWLAMQRCFHLLTATDTIPVSLKDTINLVVSTVKDPSFLYFLLINNKKKVNRTRTIQLNKNTHVTFFVSDLTSLCLKFRT